MASDFRNDAGGDMKDMFSAAEEGWVIPVQKGTRTLRESVAEVKMSTGARPKSLWPCRASTRDRSWSRTPGPAVLTR